MYATNGYKGVAKYITSCEGYLLQPMTDKYHAPTGVVTRVGGSKSVGRLMSSNSGHFLVFI